MSDAPSIHEALAAVMADVGAVSKDSRNASQGFNFRGIDAVVNAVGPEFRKHGVIALPIVEGSHYDTIPTKNGGTMRQCTLTVRWRFVGPAGDALEAVVIAEAMDSGDKATSKAHSVAYRTVLLQVLCIPTDEPDPDASTYERVPPPARIVVAPVAGREAECADAGVTPSKVLVIARRLAAQSNIEQPTELAIIPPDLFAAAIKEAAS